MLKLQSFVVVLLAALSHAHTIGGAEKGGDGNAQANLNSSPGDGHKNTIRREPLECLQVSNPVLTENGVARNNELIEERPPEDSYSVNLMSASFGNSYGRPHVAWIAPYTPPPRSFPRVYLNMTVTCQGHQFDRLATMWLGDVEIFRTSTAEPIENPGIIWHYTKDVTAFMSLWEHNNTLIFDLGNLVNDKYTGVFNVDITLHFHDTKLQGPQPDPAHFILPVSARKGHKNESSAFTYPGDKAVTAVKLPRDTRMAILTIAATGQAEEEFWWSNLPESLTGYFSDNRRLPGGSSFREVRVFIDGKLAGLAWPFPVIFTGGIAPPLHRPLVGLQAFDLREYEVDITPWLGILCDGKDHTVSMEIQAIDDTKHSNGSLAQVKNHWVLSGKIFGWRLAPGMKRQVVGKEPTTNISDVLYNLEFGKPDPTELIYNQTISRSFEVRSQLQIPSEGETTAVWKQELHMFNNGHMKYSGAWRDVDADYSGSGISKYAWGPGLSTGFRYPVSTTYWYKSPDPDTNATLTVLARLKQGMELTSMGFTPFSTGIEPFLPSYGPTADRVVSGTYLQAVRDGQAKFSQEKKHSYGFGDMRQTYELRTTDWKSVDKPWEATKGDLLYYRGIKFVNETKTEDKETIRDRPIPSKRPGAQTHGSQESPALNGWDEFAPLGEKNPGMSNRDAWRIQE
ncbi:unnamed protein product [Clonostachys rosea]|uniref:Peptide N-acetyl-beta-D-glucosaminyl asparaginase amidase A N-terminal domain-containing protein n=1 Tax=Bionectria ochroleuca TaxID=29856 RepID=A0ABY6UBK9_BIOOC|nr:unnamed protein product [Clonostachys rosea]